MARPRSRVLATAFGAILLAVCSDDPATTTPPAPPPPPPPQEPYAVERAALIALYNATNGTHWHRDRNWTTVGSIRDWQGVSTNSAGFVTELTLTDNNLSGALPPELGNLTHLRQLVLEENRLTGPIPPELGNLPELRRLVLGDNELTGSIPAGLAGLSQLTMSTA